MSRHCSASILLALALLCVSQRADAVTLAERPQYLEKLQQVLELLAPRPVLVVQPQLYRDATPADVETAVNESRKVYALYGASDKLGVRRPWDYNRLANRLQDELIQWMGQNPR